jgi:hypothetical protein
LILEGQRQARLHLKFKDPWSHEWGPVHLAAPHIKRFAFAATNESNQGFSISPESIMI